MGVFNKFFRTDNMDDYMQRAEELISNSNITDEKPAESTQENATNPSLTVSYATGWPIDVVYGYLRKNYEEQGFNDAMVKSDLTFRDMNMKIIMNRILIVFREINLRYDVMIHDLTTKIQACSAAGLLSTVNELENSITVANTHKEELKKLELDFRNNANEASIALQSYECGFLRGIATISMGGVPLGGVSLHTINDNVKTMVV